jgi:hypothetical protein
LVSITKRRTIKNQTEDDDDNGTSSSGTIVANEFPKELEGEAMDKFLAHLLFVQIYRGILIFTH